MPSQDVYKAMNFTPDAVAAKAAAVLAHFGTTGKTAPPVPVVSPFFVPKEAHKEQH